MSTGNDKPIVKVNVCNKNTYSITVAQELAWCTFLFNH